MAIGDSIILSHTGSHILILSFNHLFVCECVSTGEKSSCSHIESHVTSKTVNLAYYIVIDTIAAIAALKCLSGPLPPSIKI